VWRDALIHMQKLSVLLEENECADIYFHKVIFCEHVIVKFFL